MNQCAVGSETTTWTRATAPCCVNDPGGVDGQRAVSMLPAELRRQATVINASAGNVLFEPAWPTSTQYLLVEGIVSFRQTFGGVSVLLPCAVAQEWLGLGLDPKQAHGMRATCESATTLLSVPTRVLNTCLRRDPLFARRWQLDCARQLDRLRHYAVRLRLPHASERIAHYLVHESVNGCGELTLPFSNGVWAEQLNLAPETLSRALGEMMRAGTLERQGYRHLRLTQPPIRDTS